MGEKTGIAWCDHSFNTHWGCFKVSPGCQHCYAESVNERFTGTRYWGPTQTTERRTFGEQHWAEPLKWNARATKEGGRPHRVFCNSMADVFEDHPTVNQEREKLWDLIARTPMLTWQLLTKRPENILDMIPPLWKNPFRFPPNVWLGTSVENQAYAERRIPLLVEVAGPLVHFLSCEPLLGSLDLAGPFLLESINWVIVGAESGPRARPMQDDWVRALRDQCLVKEIAFFFKQRADTSGRKQEHPLLDGILWEQFPRE